jgi:hypothetical protein
MRADRALEKLRVQLGKRGVSSTCAALAAVLAQQTITAAPSGLAASIAGTAMTGVLAGGALATTAAAAGGGAVSGETALTILKFMGMTKIKAGAIAVIMAGMAVPLVMQHQGKEELRARNEVLQRQNTELAQQLLFTSENARLANGVASGGETTVTNYWNEVLRLRAEITLLRQEARETGQVAGVGAAEPIRATFQTLEARVTSLKERLEQMPQTKIPELRYLKEKNWLDVVLGLKKLETDDEYREALNILRAEAKGEVGGKLQAAVRKYAEANGGMLPSDLAQVQSYLEEPIEPAILERYQMVGTGKLDDLRRDQSVFQEVAPPVDEEYDTYFRFHRNGRSSTSFSQVGFAIEAAAEAYAQANGGRLPREPDQLAAYLQQPIDQKRVQKFLSEIPPHISTVAQMKERQK